MGPVLRLDPTNFHLDNLTNWVSFSIPCLLLLFRLRCSSLHLPRGIWQKTLPIMFQWTWLVYPRPHAKYCMTVMSQYSQWFLLTRTRNMYPKATILSWAGITLSTFCAEFNKICIWPWFQWQNTTQGPQSWYLIIFSFFCTKRWGLSLFKNQPPNNTPNIPLVFLL